MKTKFISLLAIILGLIVIIFPAMGIIGINGLISLSVLLISIYLLVVGTSIIDYNKPGAILDIFLGLILLVLSIFLIYNPSFIGAISGLLINNRTTRYGFYIGIAGVVLGLLYLIIGTFIADPTVLGTLIGAWLVISGILKLMDG